MILQNVKKLINLVVADIIDVKIILCYPMISFLNNQKTIRRQIL